MADKMTPEELAEMLRSHFSLSISTEKDGWDNVIRVKVELQGPDGEAVLSSGDYFYRD